MKLHTLLALATLASACNPCHSWDEVELSDPDGLDDGETPTTIQAGIDTFVAWTARDETCVDQVRLEEEMESHGEPISGQYNGVTHNIAIEADHSERSTLDTTIHEFCHALDHEEGWPSLDHADVLEPYTEGLNEILYDTPDKRTRDAFARICAVGPVLHPLWQQLEEGCGVELGDDAIRFVHDLAFAGWDSSAQLGQFTTATETWELTIDDGLEGERLVSPPVAGAQGLFHLDHVQIDEQVIPVIQRIDPSTATIVESLILDAHGPVTDWNGNPYYEAHDLIGSSTDPILWEREAPGTAWRILSGPLRLEPVTLPDMPGTTWLSGFEQDGTLLATVHTEDDGYLAIGVIEWPNWSRVELEDEELEELELRKVSIDEDGAVVLFEGSGGIELAAVSRLGEIEWTQALPCESCRGHGLWRNPDNNVIVRQYVPDMEGGASEPFPLLLDPTTGDYATPEGTCDNFAYWIDVVRRGDELWGVYRPAVGDSYGPLTLVNLEIES